MPARATKQSQPSAEETREKLLQAAILVFAQNGYERATVRMICRQAEVNIALVSYYYGDKLALYRAVIRYVTDSDTKIELLSRATSDNSDPETALRRLIYGLLERVIARKAQHGLHIRLMLNELANPTTVLKDEIEATMRPLYDHCRVLVGRILGLPPDDVKTRLCVHSIVGQVAHYAHARPILNRLWPEMQLSPEQVELVAAHIADFSLAYMRPAKTRMERKVQKP